MQIKEFKKLVFSEIKLLKDLPLIESNHSEASSPKFAINLIDVPGYETQLLPDLTGEVHLDVLLALHDHVFIFACFQYFLNRTPDPEGMNHYLEKLRSGEYNKPDIVSRIWISKEAKSIGKKLSSGKLVLCKSLLLQVPVFGSVLKYFSIVKNLPNLQRQINESHAQNMALQTHLQSYLRESFSIVSENSCSVIFVLDTLKQKVSSLETEVKNSKEELKNLYQVIFTLTDKNESNEKQILIAKNYIKELENAIYKLNLFKAQSTKDTYQSQQKIDGIFNYKESLDEKLRVNNEHLNRITADFDKHLSDSIPHKEESDTKFDNFYLQLENSFRGTQDDVRERQTVYLQYIEEVSKKHEEFQLLDLACGRGEWLRLVSESGYKAIGVDINSESLALCREWGADVIISDLLEYLESLPAESVSVISAFHIVEHLPFKLVLKVLTECHRVLKLEGMLIVETPNPGNLLVGSNTFYTDPTHLKPIPISLLEFAFKFSGLLSIEVLKLHPHERFNTFKDFTGAEVLDDVIFGAQDYAVMGVK